MASEHEPSAWRSSDTRLESNHLRQVLNAVQYGVREDDHRIDMARVAGLLGRTSRS